MDTEFNSGSELTSTDHDVTADSDAIEGEIMQMTRRINDREKRFMLSSCRQSESGTTNQSSQEPEEVLAAIRDAREKEKQDSGEVMGVLVVPIGGRYTVLVPLRVFSFKAFLVVAFVDPLRVERRKKFMTVLPKTFKRGKSAIELT